MITLGAAAGKWPLLFYPPNATPAIPRGSWLALKGSERFRSTHRFWRTVEVGGSVSHHKLKVGWLLAYFAPAVAAFRNIAESLCARPSEA